MIFFHQIHNTISQIANLAKCNHAWRLPVLTVLAILVTLETPRAQQVNLEMLQGIEETITHGPLSDEGLQQSRGGNSSGAASLSEDGARMLGPSLANRLLMDRFCSGSLSRSQEAIIRLMPDFSPLEREYCSRAGRHLEQFGYQSFQRLFLPVVLGRGKVEQGYILGIGDELIITFSGKRMRTAAVRIDPEGKVILDQIGPIVAAGRTLSDFRAELQATTSRIFLGRSVFVSLGQVGAISVLVAGEVRNPGLHRLTSLSTLVDALVKAGGPTKSGSLRMVQLRRSGKTQIFDLYELLRGTEQPEDFRLSEGDRIVVPGIGRTIAVTGDVKRPGIYELHSNESIISTTNTLSLAGGLLRPRGNEINLISVDDSGRDVVLDGAGTMMGDGDLLVVSRAGGGYSNSVSLVGHVNGALRRSIAAAPTIGALLRDGTIGDSPYLSLAILETSDPITKARRLFAISAQRVFEGMEDYKLREGDRLIILSSEDVTYLSRPEVQRILMQKGKRSRRSVSKESKDRLELGKLEEGAINAARLQSLLKGHSPANSDQSEAEQVSSNVSRIFGRQQCTSLDNLDRLVRDFRADRYANALLEITRIDDFAANGDTALSETKCMGVYENVSGLLPFILENATLIVGGIRRPGIYPVVEDTPFSELVSNGGGLARDTDLSRIEITRAGVGGGNTRETLDMSRKDLASLTVGPGDVVRLYPVYRDREAGFVELVGEFVRPGKYDIRRGDRLSSVIERAGGLTPQSYPYGAIFTRESVKRAEEESLQRLARELNAAISVAAVNKGVDGGVMSAFQELSERVAGVPPTGRVVIEADPTILSVQPDRDVILRQGDRLYMPKRPSSVLVTGEVRKPGALQFVAGTAADDYIKMAGGLRRTADEAQAFLVFPNGAAQPLSLSPFNFSTIQIPPGTIVVVPTDATPFNLLSMSKEVLSVLSQLAITAASLAVISD